jgi:hypothetical protein
MLRLQLVFKVVYLLIFFEWLGTLTLVWLNYSQGYVVKQDLIIINQSNYIVHEVAFLLLSPLNLYLFHFIFDFLFLNIFKLQTQYLEHDLNEYSNQWILSLLIHLFYFDLQVPLDSQLESFVEVLILKEVYETDEEWDA